MASGWWAREEEEGSLELTRGNVGLGSYSGCLSWRVRSCPWLCSSAGTIGPEYFANSSHSCAGHCSKHFIAVVYSLSHAQLFDTPWTSARQASLSFTISWSLLKLMSIESVMTYKSHPVERLLLSCESHQDSWAPEEKNSVWGQWHLNTQCFCVIKFY